MITPSAFLLHWLLIRTAKRDLLPVEAVHRNPLVGRAMQQGDCLDWNWQGCPLVLPQLHSQGRWQNDLHD